MHAARQSVTFAAGVAAARITGLGSEGAPAAKPAPAAPADAMQAALAELSAQWLASHASNPVPNATRAAASEEAGSPAPQPLAGDDGWSMAAEAQAEASTAGPEAQTSASRIWDTARLAFAEEQPAPSPAPAVGSSVAPRRRGASDEARGSSAERALPSLLLQALAPLPRQQLLQASMAALYAQLPDVVAQARASSAASLDWDDTARRALAAAVVAAGRAWFAGYPQFRAELAAAATQPALAAGDAGSALALAPEAALAAVQPMAYIEALSNAGADASEADALGGRAALYGTLVQSLAQGDLALSAAEWGTSGTLLGGAQFAIASLHVCVADTPFLRSCGAAGHGCVCVGGCGLCVRVLGARRVARRRGVTARQPCTIAARPVRHAGVARAAAAAAARHARPGALPQRGGPLSLGAAAVHLRARHLRGQAAAVGRRARRSAPATRAARLAPR